MSKNNRLKWFIAIVALFVSSVNATIPSYIHVCKRNNPDISKCIISSVENLRSKLIQGIPDLEVPSIDPLKLEYLSLNLGPGLKADGRNLLIYGLKDFQIRRLVVNIKEDIFNLEIFAPVLSARGTYELDAKIASIPLKGTGPLILNAQTVTGQATLHGKKILKGGKTLYYFPKMDLKLQLADYDLKLENIGGGDPTLGKVTNQVLKDEKASILQTILPAIEKALSQYILNSANNICKHFTWDELFPES